MTDARLHPEISPASVLLALFHAFVFRLPSFQQLDSELGHCSLQHWIGAERPFRDDTLRYSLCGFDLGPLETMLVEVNRRFKRGKVFDQGRVQGRLVAALDGIEVLSSFIRHGENCLQRRVTRKDQAGRKIEETQYYHRAVGCQMIHSRVKPFLAFEWLQPGEGEETAALRLLRRLPQQYGSRFFDILLLDAQAPVLELAQKSGGEVVISLKQNSRDLYQSAVRWFARRPPEDSFTESQDHKNLSRVALGYRRIAVQHRSSGARACGPLRGSPGAESLPRGPERGTLHESRMALDYDLAILCLPLQSHSSTGPPAVEKRKITAGWI